MANNKVTLHRVFTAPPEKVYKAFTDADAMASWLPPYGFVCKVHSMDFKIGGKYKMSFTNFTHSTKSPDFATQAEQTIQINNQKLQNNIK
jgi:uncharacterized protein YndB with AHSA1/START domain